MYDVCRILHGGHDLYQGPLWVKHLDSDPIDALAFSEKEGVEMDEEFKEEKEEVEEEKREEVEKEEEIQEEKVMAEVERHEEPKVEERGGISRVLVYVALVFAIVALVLSFWNVGLHRVVGVLEDEQSVLEKGLNEVQKRALLAQFQLDTQRVYILTMGEHDYTGASRVLDDLERELAGLKAYIPADQMSRMDSLVKALKGEVARGPSPIPGIVAQLQKISGGLASPALPISAEMPAVKPVPAPAKEKLVEEAPKPPPKPEHARPKGSGFIHNFYMFWSRLGEKIVGK